MYKGCNAKTCKKEGRIQCQLTAVVPQLNSALALQAEDWVFEVVKTGSDSSTAKLSPIGVSVTGL